MLQMQVLISTHPNWFCESQVPCCLRELWLLALENWEALQAA